MHTASPPPESQDSAPKLPSRWLSGWALRGYLSTLGQGLQLVSSVKGAGKPSDRAAIFGFTVVNLLANAINILFGAQHKDDPHQLRYLKEQVNQTLAPLSEQAALPDPTQTLTTTPVDHSTMGILRRYSVTVSEFVLRTAGSLSLIAPITGWGKAYQNLRGGMGLAETFKLAKNQNAVTFGAGLFSLAGKGFILAASEPDPYRPEPPSLWRRMRESVMFRASSVSEAIGAAWMAHDRLTNQQSMIGGKLRPDYYGGFGNISVLAGYVPRWIAPYGTREVDMEELYTHAAAGIRALPEAKRELAEQSISEQLAQHFAKPELTAAQIRTQLAAHRAAPSATVTRATHHATIDDSALTALSK